MQEGAVAGAKACELWRTMHSVSVLWHLPAPQFAGICDEAPGPAHVGRVGCRTEVNDVSVGVPLQRVRELLPDGGARLCGATVVDMVVCAYCIAAENAQGRLYFAVQVKGRLLQVPSESSSPGRMSVQLGPSSSSLAA